MGLKRKFYETQAFIALQTNWYEKLKETGFTDQEKLVGLRMLLTQSSPHPYRHSPTPLTREARLNYYLFIGERVALEEFESERDHLIMAMRADGLKIKEIVKRLKQSGYPIHRQTVRFIIRRFETKWQIRIWREDQMTSNQVTG